MTWYILPKVLLELVNIKFKSKNLARLIYSDVFELLKLITINRRYLWRFYFFVPQVHFTKTQLGTWTSYSRNSQLCTEQIYGEKQPASKESPLTFPKMEAVIKTVMKAISLKKLLQKSSPEKTVQNSKVSFL